MMMISDELSNLKFDKDLLEKEAKNHMLNLEDVNVSQMKEGNSLRALNKFQINKEIQIIRESEGEDPP